MRSSKKLLWFVLVPGLPGVIALPFLYFLVWIPSEIATNERNASTQLKTLTSAEADFRANDLDGNHVNDFWTGDVAGLYYVNDIRRILREVAEADARPLKPLVPSPIPCHGYFFIALDEDDNVAGTPEQYYRQDTQGNPRMGKVHNTSKFGFCAYPAEYGVTGTYTFIVNENNTIFRADMKGKVTTHFPDDRPKTVPGSFPPRED